MIKYGLISETDARCLEKTIDLICDEFPHGDIFITEIGVYGGDTGSGMYNYIWDEKDRSVWMTGIDNFKDNESVRHTYHNMIIGNSNEVYNQLEDNSQHLILEDSCHCFACVCSTFFCYAPKVKVGGYLAFHDTGEHIKPFKDFQHGDKNNPDAYISVRKALVSMALIEYEHELTDNGSMYAKSFPGWGLIFDEADETNEAGGICVFRKLY